jgi:hypothetical protein
MRSVTRCLLLLALLFICSNHVEAQKQLIVLKNQDVLLRLYPGDEIVFSLKGSKKRIRRSYVNNLYDTAVVAHKDVIPYHKIERIYFKRSNLVNIIGGLLVVGGVGYIVIDQFNQVVVHGESASVDESVAISSAVMIGVGLPLLLTKKKYARIGGKYRILTVDKGSGFYMPDLRKDVGELNDD